MLLVYPLTLELVKKNIVCKEINRLIIRDKLTAKTVFFQKENTTMRQTEKKIPNLLATCFQAHAPESSG